MLHDIMNVVINMKKNELVQGTCIDYTNEGLGIVKIDGFPVFVKNLLIGEEA